MKKTNVKVVRGVANWHYPLEGLALDPAAGGGGEADDEQDHRMDAEDNERDDGHEDEEMTSDDAEDSGKTKETSVHRKHFMWVLQVPANMKVILLGHNK